MPGIFEALPGIEAPVGAISKGLAQMWEGEATEGKPSPAGEHSKAIQVNFVPIVTVSHRDYLGWPVPARAIISDRRVCRTALATIRYMPCPSGFLCGENCLCQEPSVQRGETLLCVNLAERNSVCLTVLLGTPDPASFIGA